jgi:hypothetical protein
VLSLVRHAAITTTATASVHLRMVKTIDEDNGTSRRFPVKIDVVKAAEATMRV